MSVDAATPSPLEGQVAIVTGASRGIGRAVAVELARHGAIIVVNYRERREAASETVARVEALGGEASAIQADVSLEEDVRRLVSATIEAHRRIDHLVCNAGVVQDALIAAMRLADWQRVVETNLRGAFLCIREVVPQMMAQRSGSIVNLTSIHATTGGRGQANYVAAKAGLAAMTRALAVELAAKGIRVNAVAPGIIRTEMTAQIRQATDDRVLEEVPLRRYGEPEDVARAVRFLCSPEASYITGVTLAVAGGYGL